MNIIKPKTIFLDESGYTGHDLMSSEQKVFVLASTDFDEVESRELIRKFFPNSQAFELKHQALAKRPRGQQQIAALINELVKHKNRISVYVIHKKFYLFQKFVDCWLEPVMHQTEFNFYQDGMNIEFCNMAFICLNTFEGEQFIDRLLTDYQTMLSKQSEESFFYFFNLLSNMCEHVTKTESIRIVEFFSIIPQFLDFNHIATLGRNPNDPALTTAIQIVVHWKKKLSAPFFLLHDQSSNLARKKSMWDAITSPTAPQASVGHGDHRTVEFPLNVLETRFVDSRLFPSLQITDILAGAVARFASHKISPCRNMEYARILEEAGLEQLISDAVWPTTETNNLSSLSNHNDIDPHDYFINVLS